MSRWMQQFESHTFRGSWDLVKSYVDQAKVDDQSVITSVSELGRLKKVVSYIDSILKSLDPELVPLTTWDSFGQQANLCANEIASYNINRNIGHIQNANVYTDNLLTYVRPYMIATGRLAKGLRESAAAYSSAFTDYSSAFKKNMDSTLDEISEEKAEILKHKKKIEEVSLALSATKEKFLGDGVASAGEISELQSKIDEFTEKYKKILSISDAIFVGDGESHSLETSVKNAVSEAQTDAKTIKALAQQSEDVITELSEFHQKIFGAVSEGGEKEGGLQAEIEKGMARLIDFENQQKIRYTTLNEKIESLLPGATSAGLASSCKLMKSSFDAPIQMANKIFYGAIAFLFVLAAFFAVDGISSTNGIQFVKFGKWQDVIGGLVLKAPFFAPFVWLAYYASTRRSEFQRLQQEYAHKEVVANSYESYKRQVEALGASGGDLLKQLLEKAISAISYNASETLDKKHGDKMPAHTAIEKLIETTEKLVDKIPKA